MASDRGRSRGSARGACRTAQSAGVTVAYPVFAAKSSCARQGMIAALLVVDQDVLDALLITTERQQPLVPKSRCSADGWPAPARWTWPRRWTSRRASCCARCSSTCRCRCQSRCQPCPCKPPMWVLLRPVCAAERATWSVSHADFMSAALPPPAPGRRQLPMG